MATGPDNLLSARRRRAPRIRGVAGPLSRSILAAPGERPPWWLEAAMIGALCTVYDAVTNLAPLRRAAAIAHGRALLGDERALGLSPERGLDSWLSGHHGLALAASDFYDNAHFVVTIGVLIWLWVWHADHYRPLRRALVLTNLAAFVVFLIYPTAPPRLIPGAGFADVVAQTGAIGSWHTGTLAEAANQYAAMPSLHLAWAWWSVFAIWQIRGARSGRWLLAAYPLVVGAIVMSTGNHYLLDAVAGTALAVCAVGLGRREPRGISTGTGRRRRVELRQPEHALER